MTMEMSQSVEETPTQVIPLGSRTLAEVGQIADEVAARNAFARHRERQAAETIRRHRTDLALFAQYLADIPDLHMIGQGFRPDHSLPMKSRILSLPLSLNG
jgi:hypothetical protein